MKVHFTTLQQAISHVIYDLKHHGDKITTNKWQGIDLEQVMLETHGVYFNAPVPTTIYDLHLQTQATLPWAEDHFQERIKGEPLNPGNEYKNWPFYSNDEKFRNVNEKFSHTYMERYWPKRAGDMPPMLPKTTRRGLRYSLGDLQDVINLLIAQPDTRQAYLPVWFPEDTGVLHGGRVPCTIGYHFIIRNDKLHIHYQIRACDAVRHFRNDIYLTCRLLQYVFDSLPKVRSILTLGNLPMDIISFHAFAQEKNLL
jgi:thymidylate synthase